MITEQFLRSIVIGAYLVALLLNGRFDLFIAALAGSIVLIWAVPQWRVTHRRRGEAH